MNGIEYASERAEGRLEGSLVFGVVGQKAEGGANEGAGVNQFVRDTLETAR